jgi:limonene-1,2-epoxide hydrolase
MNDDNEQAVELVRRFCGAWSEGDLDRVVEFFADDAVYHNIPVDPVVGTDAIRTMIEEFTVGIDRIEFRIDNIASAGNVVLTERVDIFVKGGRRIELPVMGTFEVVGGRIAKWRDYFDLNQFMSQLA